MTALCEMKLFFAVNIFPRWLNLLKRKVVLTHWRGAGKIRRDQSRID
jgi:hypothetical protein